MAYAQIKSAKPAKGAKQKKKKRRSNFNIKMGK